MNNNHTDMLSSMILTRTFSAWTSFLWPWGGRPSSGGRAERCCCWRGGEREISCCRGAGRGRRGSDGRRAAEATAVHLTSRVNTGCSCSPSLRSQSSSRLVWRWWCLFSCLRGKKQLYIILVILRCLSLHNLLTNKNKYQSVQTQWKHFPPQLEMKLWSCSEDTHPLPASELRSAGSISESAVPPVSAWSYSHRELAIWCWRQWLNDYCIQSPVNAERNVLSPRSCHVHRYGSTVGFT